MAAGIEKTLKIDAVVMPVLTEALIGPVRSKVTMLDGLILALDQVEDTGLTLIILST